MLAFTRSALLFGLATQVNQCIAGYALEDDYNPSSFFSMFSFFTAGDPTNGFVQYVDEGTAQSSGLISTNGDNVYIGVDTTNIATNGRPSVRVTSNKAYNHGLIILDLEHMPEGCGTWPAFWMFGPNWPNSGEVDIIEGVNQQTTNSMTLHTVDGLTISNNGDFSGSISTSNCYVDAPGQSSNAGCSISASSPLTYGSGFNSNGGGVYATDWTSQGISIYFFARGSIPDDITNGEPDPSGWGEPTAMFSPNANLDSFIMNQNIVFDMTFCGDWAGGVWGSSSCASLADTCNDYVMNNPSAFDNAYWTVNSLQVYQDNGETTDPVTSSSLLPTTTASPVGTAITTTVQASELSTLTVGTSILSAIPNKATSLGVVTTVVGTIASVDAAAATSSSVLDDATTSSSVLDTATTSSPVLDTATTSSSVLDAVTTSTPATSAGASPIPTSASDDYVYDPYAPYDDGSGPTSGELSISTTSTALASSSAVLSTEALATSAPTVLASSAPTVLSSSAPLTSLASSTLAVYSSATSDPASLPSSADPASLSSSSVTASTAYASTSAIAGFTSILSSSTLSEQTTSASSLPASASSSAIGRFTSIVSSLALAEQSTSSSVSTASALTSGVAASTSILSSSALSEQSTSATGSIALISTSNTADSTSIPPSSTLSAQTTSAFASAATSAYAAGANSTDGAAGVSTSMTDDYDVSPTTSSDVPTSTGYAASSSDSSILSFTYAPTTSSSALGIDSSETSFTYGPTTSASVAASASSTSTKHHHKSKTGKKGSESATSAATSADPSNSSMSPVTTATALGDRPSATATPANATNAAPSTLTQIPTTTSNFLTSAAYTSTTTSTAPTYTYTILPYFPVPMQGGAPDSCTAFYMAVPGDTCNSISASFGNFTTEQFMLWNLPINIACTNMWAEYYFCINGDGDETLTRRDVDGEEEAKVNDKALKRFLRRIEERGRIDSAVTDDMARGQISRLRRREANGENVVLAPPVSDASNFPAGTEGGVIVDEVEEDDEEPEIVKVHKRVRGNKHDHKQAHAHDHGHAHKHNHTTAEEKLKQERKTGTEEVKKGKLEKAKKKAQEAKSAYEDALKRLMMEEEEEKKGVKVGKRDLVESLVYGRGL